MLGIEDWLHHVQPENQPWGLKVSTFQVEGQGHRVNELKPFFYRLLIVGSSIKVCAIKVCSNGGATYIICEIITKNTLNIANLMQTFENLLLQNY